MGELICVRCGSVASFMTPHGLMCRIHALEAAEDDGIERDWVPVSIKERLDDTAVEIDLDEEDEPVEV